MALQSPNGVDGPLPDHVLLKTDNGSVIHDEWAYGRVPFWATSMTDRRRIMPWNSEQYVAEIGIQNVLTIAIIDTGCTRTVIDHRMV